ncbi:MAG: pyrroloquinoline quinone-dependent dehydrogenase [Acidobacteriia bacterium]|nr:pyrroloquinoline quinone-dependent dehydrogenase [Terriglobia bacterium]
MRIFKSALIACLAMLALAIASLPFAGASDDEWPAYGRDPGGQRFSPLAAINRQNVATLKPDWTFRTGDAYQPKRGRPTAFEATPLYLDGVLYLGTPLGRIIALDPVTGKERWSYDGKTEKDKGYGDFANRGVSTWKSAAGERRIFIATIDARLIAVDAATGKPCSGFGDNGIVNLRNGLRIAPRGFADYEETSPPAIVGNTVIVGSGVADNGAVDMPSGEVRGFDAVSGKLKWTWHPIPQDPQAPGADTWKNGSARRTGAANAWSVIAADPTRNLVFVPTGSPSPDYYGGERLGDNLFANSLVALRASTGERIWHFQTVHHDLWDYDVASPPILFDVHRNGQTIAAVGVGSKDGNFFILNRDTGKPIFGVEERPVPKSDVEWEVSSPTQPFPLAPPPLSPQKLTEAWGPDEASRKWCQEEIGKLRSDGVFTPPSLRGSFIIPGNIGGMAWGGAAYDAQNHLLVIPTNNFAAEVRLIPRADFERQREEAGRNLNGDWEFAEQRGTPYGMARRFLRSPGGSPCNPPPWGVLNGVDADTGAVKWTVPSGQLPKIGDAPAAPASFGSIALGGPIVTAGGLVFMAGTLDPAIRAYDISTGKELWKSELPTSARSTPMTFRGPDGRQYLVVSAGGHGIPGAAPLGDYVVAFSLPRQ